jgi:GxxExxY protein
MAELKYKDITEKIIGAAMKVHSALGNGFQEVIYQRALAWEFSNAGLDYAREIEQGIFYKDLQEPIGTRRADFVVEGKVLVELKAIEQSAPIYQAKFVSVSDFEICGPSQADRTAFVALVIAVRQALDYDDTVKAVIVCVIAWVIMLVAWAMVGILGFGAAMAGGALTS